MTRLHRLVAVVVGAVLSVPAVFIASSMYFDAMVRSEYASGIRTSTGGDSTIIPVISVTVVWTIVLLVGGVIAGGVVLIRRARRGAV